MKKNAIFRTLNGLGFIANSASLCMPYGSPMRAACKGISFVCNVSSSVMMWEHKKKGIMPIFSVIGAMLDAGAVGEYLFPSSGGASDEMTAQKELALNKILSAGMTVMSGAIQFGMVQSGIDPEEDAEAKRKAAITEGPQETKRPWYILPDIKIKNDHVFRAVNGIGLMGNMAAQCFPVGSPMHANCKAVSFGSHLVSYAMMQVHEQDMSLKRALGTDDGSYPLSKTLKMLPRRLVVLSAAIFDGFRGFPAFGFPVRHAAQGNTDMFIDGASSIIQAVNLYAGFDPDKDSVSVLRAKKAQQKKLDEFKPQ